MKNATLKKLLMTTTFCGLLSAPHLHAQITIEAENPITSHYAELDSRSGFSGGLGIGLRATYGATATYEVSVTESGTYDLAIDYVTMNVRHLTVKVNNQVQTVWTFDDFTTTWDGSNGTAKTKIKQIYLDAGDNTIVLGGFEGYSPTESNNVIGFAPPVDKFTISKSESEITKPADQIDIIIVEAESAVIKTGNIGVSSQPIFSGASGIGGNSGYAEYSVLVNETGTYDLAIFYATMDERSISVKVNKQAESTIKFTEKTKSWGDKPSNDANIPSVFRKTIQIYLEKGANRIRLGAAGGWTPNLDKFEIIKSGLQIAEPAIQYAAFISDLTYKLLEVKEQTVTSSENLKKLFDNKESSIYRVEGVNSTQIEVKLSDPILLTHYSLAASPSSAEDVATWTLEYSNDGAAWAAVPLAGSVTDNEGFKTFKTTINHNNRSVAQYFRLTATGDGVVEIGEWQLHGVPCIGEDAQFLSDLTRDGEGNAMGTITASAPGWGGKEVFANVIDRKISTKYTVEGAKTFWLQYQYETPTIVNSYELSVPWSYLGRNPKSWTFMGSDDGQAWTTLDTRSNINFSGETTTLSFDAANETAYSYYKLNVTANHGNGEIQLLQWQMFNKDAVVQSVTPAVDLVEIAQGQSETMAVSLMPEDVVMTDLIWTIESESGEGIVSIENGEVKGLSRGTARLRVTSASNPLAFAFVEIRVSDPVSIDNTSATTLRIYPNPVAEKLNVETDGLIKTIRAFSANGQQVYSQEGGTPIGVSNWANGVYYLQVTTENETSMHKIVKN